MRWAVLGSDVELAAAAEHVLHQPGQTLHCAVVSDSLWNRLLRIAPGLKRAADGADLLADTRIEGLICGGAEAWIPEAARQFALARADESPRTAGEGAFLIVVPHAAWGDATAYELAFAAGDRQGEIRVWTGLELNQAARELLAGVDAGRLGRVVKVELERVIPSDTSRMGQAGLPAADVDAALFRDLALLTRLAGEAQQVTAVAQPLPAVDSSRSTGGERDELYDAGQILLAAPGRPAAVWSFRVGGNVPERRLTVTGSAGSAEVVLEPEGTVRWRTPAIHPSEGTGSIAAQLPAWPAALRWYEVLEGVHRSRRRRRTIDLRTDLGSERSNFKSQMAAAGCSVLMLTLLLFLLLLAAGAAAQELGLPLQFPVGGVVVDLRRLAPWLLALPLLVFLGLQPLIGLTPREPAASDRATVPGPRAHG